jgi:hypothetical protein
MPSNTIPPNSSKLLHGWRVMEAVSPTGIRSRHVCGQNAQGDMGISTSAIEEFNPVTMTVKTRSDKTYTLVGPPGESRLGSAAWEKWCRDNGTFAEVDVTSDYTNSGSKPESTITFKRLGVLAAD